ncbi:histone H1 [Heterostelium album PN500]|uniref:Histone H1 n=1 Tax=Heterostelium pallidum (strain ATCC 26659 / Pp 5 / PN500) TaxID=670386 RepID=D3BM50_HETP5|nr:histone H1 [Heterostelium album PN500]EFA77651.1 histone H1 [Heterostelium album PN500]|eukprot:XP_020429779.1 histone H1 [Heterostelium album PN500]
MSTKSKSFKSTSTTKKSSTSKKSFNPTYKVMITKAIEHYKDRTGSSIIAIKKYIEDHYNVNQTAFHTNLRLALNRLVENNSLVKVKVSYKLPPKSDTAKKSTTAAAVSTPVKKSTTTASKKVDPKKKASSTIAKFV